MSSAWAGHSRVGRARTEAAGDACAYGTPGCPYAVCTRDYCRRTHLDAGYSGTHTEHPAPHGYDATGLPLDQEDTP